MEDERRFTRLWSFCYGKTMAIIALFINIKVLNHGSFQSFLNKGEKMHAMFHQWIPNIPCCQCLDHGFHHVDRTVITEPQMTSMYDLKGNANPYHERKNSREKITQYCLCKISAKPGVSIYDVDIGTVRCILRTFANGIFQRVEHHINTIKEFRNYLAHSADQKLTESEFNEKWKELEASVLSIAYDISPSHKEHEAQQITHLKETDISRDEIIKILDTMNEKNRKQWEDILKSFKDLEAIQHDKTSVELENLRCQIKNLTLVISSGRNYRNIKQQLRRWKCCLCCLCYEQQEEETVLIRWTIETPKNWNVKEIKRRLDNSFTNFGDFVLKFVKLGSIIIGTIVSTKIIANPEQFKPKVVSFFTDLVEVGKIDVDTPAVISVSYTVEDNIAAKSVSKTVKKKDAVLWFGHVFPDDTSEFYEVDRTTKIKKKILYI